MEERIISNVYALFAHNYIAFAYFFGLLLAIGLSIYRPSRFTVFSLLGFAILLFSYEYDKHIIAPFRDQTIRSLSLTESHYKISRLIDLVITNILPILFYVAGWFFIYLAIYYAAVRLTHDGKHHKR